MPQRALSDSRSGTITRSRSVRRKCYTLDIGVARGLCALAEERHRARFVEEDITVLASHNRTSGQSSHGGEFHGTVLGGLLLRVAWLSVVLAFGWEIEPAQSALYWCPGPSGEGVIADYEQAGCVPFDPKEEAARRVTTQTRPPITDFERHTQVFLQRYREVLACCATDPASMDQIDDLEAQATHHLKEVETKMYDLLRIRALQAYGVIAPVANAREQLRELKSRLTEIHRVLEQLPKLDFEAAARERRRIEGIQDAIRTEYSPSKEPIQAPTGRVIGVTPPTGPDIGVAAPRGPEIGRTSPTGPDIGQTPPFGSSIGVTPPMGSAIGDALPNQPREDQAPQ